MKFGPTPIDKAAGLVLGHTLRAGGMVLRKGHAVTGPEAAALKAAGVKTIAGARLEDGDVGEDAAAAEIARLCAGAGVRLTAARTGRCNLEALAAGVVRVDAATVDAVNRVNEAVTIATLGDYAAANAGQIVATVKIIPYAVAGAVMEALRALLQAPALSVAAYQPRRTALISTLTPDLKSAVVTATEAVTTKRVNELGGTMIQTVRIPHDAGAVSRACRAALGAGAEMILISGASATADRDDVAPAGIIAAGGALDHFGMPVDPGNLLVLAHIKDTPVLVLPGCARSPKLNGADWVMQRLAAGIAVTGRDIMGMGVGGLLVDTPTRPLPRAAAVKDTASEKPAAVADAPDEDTEITPPHANVAAVVLAAGQSRRMGPHNKLVMPLQGKPLIRRTVETILEARPAQVVVVTGHEPAVVMAALSGLPVSFVHNPRYAEGLSTSLQAGLGGVDAAVDGAMICLADMPSLTAAHLQKLMAGFDPEADRAIGVPVHQGRRGNPVLWDRRFFEPMQAIAGDVGARHLIGANESLVYQVEFDDTAVLTDLDTPEQWSEYVFQGSSFPWGS